MIPHTINELALRARAIWPDQPFLQIRAGEQVSRLSFREVLDQAENLAKRLRALGYETGDHIALLSENRPEWIIAYLGILLAGGVAIPIDAMLPVSEIVTVISLSHSRALITTRKFEQLIREAADSRITLPAIHAMEEFLATADRKNPGLDRVELPVVSTDSPAVILFTSGTTGFSKGVVLSHSNLIGDVQAIIDTDVIRSDDNFHLILPLHHTYSSTANLLGALALGARATFATSYKSRDLVDDIRLAGITTLVGVPLVFENIMIGIRRSIADAPALKRTLFRLLYGISAAGSLIRLSLGAALFRSLREKAGLGSLRRMISGGAALRPEVNIFFERLGFSLLQGYGLTETSPVLTVNRPGRNRIGSVGTPLPGVELKIDDPDDNGVGEICARGPMIMQGYFENPAATSEVLRDGWFHTGDAGFLDRHGALHITGRLKNVIVTGGGKNVYPEEIEARLDLSPFILESLVVSISRKRGGGEELAALIVPQYTFIKQESERGHMMDVHQEIKTVVEAYNHSVPAYRRLRQWRIQEQEFDKTSTRKIRRYLYKDVFKLADAAK